WSEPLRHGWMRENGVAQRLIWQLCQHRGLHAGHDFPRLGPDHREAENAVVICTDERLHEALGFFRRLSSQYSAHRQLRDPHCDAVALRIPFAHSHMRERRVGEHAIGYEPIARAAVSSAEIVPDDAKVIAGDVRELWAAGAVAHGPDPRR